jgi:hypothetical protein
MTKSKRRFREFADGDWRQDSTYIVSRTVYTKKFAWFPIKTESGERIWFKTYYKRQQFWRYHAGDDIGLEEFLGYNCHPEKPTKISSEDYMFRKLAEAQ